MKTKKTIFIILLAFASIVFKAQIPSYIIGSPNQCYSAGGNTTQAVVTTTVPGAASYTWSVNSGTTCTAAFTGGSTNGTVANFFFPCCGVFTINCTAYTGLGVPIPGAMPSQTVNIQCTTFTPNFSYVQTPSGANFINTTVNSNSTIPLNYYWNFGDGSTSTLYSPSHTYSSSGIYTVTLHDSIAISPSCGMLFTQTVSICNLTINAPTTILTNATVTFSGVATPTSPTSNYLWQTTGAVPATTQGTNATNATLYYPSNGSAVVLFAYTSAVPFCSVSVTHSLQVNTNSCNLNASFTHTVNSNGVVNFANTSTGTVATTSFTWNSGNGNFSFVNTPTFTYNTPGTYTASLIVNNNMIPWCVDTASVVVVISPTTNPCSLNANFTVTTGANGLKNFINTSTGTSTNASYTWIFGDGNSSNLQSPSHTYSSNGTYTVSLIINNNSVPLCVDSIKGPISVSNVNSPCNLNASFTHTMGTGGQVSFFNTSTGTNSTTTYHWNFGNGFTSTAMHPWQAYANGGTHLVSLFVSNGNGCSDSTIVAVNVTGLPCTANSNFTVLPTTTPKFWYAVPNYPWNITKAHWNWGDGSSDSLLYTSHLYSVSATYSICLTVTVSCGASSSTCVNQFIYKGAGEQMDILGINVVQPSSQITAINESSFEKNSDFKIIPNPSNGIFEFQSQNFEGLPTHLSIYNLLGEKVYETNQPQMKANTQLNLEYLNNGVYFINLNSTNKHATIKIMIEK